MIEILYYVKQKIGWIVDRRRCIYVCMFVCT